MGKRLTIEDDFDPLKQLAYSFDVDDDEELFEEEPVDVQEFIESKDFLNLKWDGKRGCRPKIMEIAKELEKPDMREAILLLGKGSGKDFISSIFHLYGIYKCLCMYSPQKYYGLAPGSPIYFVNTARNDTQARNVFFAEFKGMLSNCAWFQGRYAEPGSVQVNFDKNIKALSANSQAFGWLGYNTIQWVGDELAFFLANDNVEESESRAEECWEAAYGSCQTRFPDHYKMIGITTPRFDDDFVMTKMAQLKDWENGFTIQAATWDIHPNMTIENFRHGLNTKYRRTMRDFGAVPMGVIESFWPDPDFVEDNVCDICHDCPVYQNRELTNDTELRRACYDNNECKANMYQGNGEWRDWSIPDATAEYHMHFDLSINKDMLGFSLGRVVDYITIEMDTVELMEEHQKLGIDISDMDEDDRFVERPIIKIEAVGHVAPSSDFDFKLIKNKELHYDSVLRLLIFALSDRGFDITKITFDRFQSHYVKQTLEDRGYEVEYISLDRNDEIPTASQETIVENRVEYPYHYVLCREAKHLKQIKGKVDHVKKESKDVWDGFAGTIYNCEEADSGSGTFIGMNDNEEY